MGVAIDVEVAEVELPDELTPVGAEIGEVAVGVGESEADLDEAESVDVGFEEVVEVTGVSAAEKSWLRLVNNAGKLSVHGDEGEIFDDSADQLKLRVEILSPDRTNHDRTATIGEICIRWIGHRHRFKSYTV